MTGKIFGDLGNELLWRIKFDVLKSSNNFQKRHLINLRLSRITRAYGMHQWSLEEVLNCTV